MRLMQKIIKRIFFLRTGLWNKKEPRVINKADAKESELHLIHILREQNANRILVICAEDFKSHIYFTKLKERMNGAGLKLTLYAAQVENPSITLVEQCVHLFFSNNCQAILAIGGGSIIDLAKATKARIIRSEKSLHKLRGLGKIRSSNKSAPVLIAGPTTITAAESSKAAWIVDHTNQIKYILNDRALQPNYVMHCAEYLTTLSNQLLVETSLGTLAQAFESLLSKNNSDYINKNALEAISEILNCLENMANNPASFIDNNQTIAGKNQMIETLLNSAFKTGNASGRSGAGYITAIANALTVFCNLPYSIVAGLTLPLILEVYLNKKPSLFARFGNDFNVEKTITQINGLSKTRSTVTAHQPAKQTKFLPIREISEYVKKDIDSIHSPPLKLSDEKLNEILQKISQRIFD
ncbi:MAG TPA: iron-containing alcohol dehydrogenase [Clostridiaceae bacterium]|nr:iron-containing alcohol dehydrogenase [Clostridiaceae bacterium]